MLDFGALPPEINSGRMYSGPGSGPVIAAASAWDALATGLESVARGYSSALSRLTGQNWSGPASVAMATAAAPYVAWVTTAGAQAEQAASQARAAAAAYEAAFAATVPPAVVAANRAQLAMLVATNFFGQNTAAIAATEAQYAEMWAQDAAAMYGYAGSSAAATRLTPFSEPPPTTSPAGQAAQAAAVAQATGTSTAAHSQAALSQVMAAVPQQLQTLSTAGSSGSSTSLATLPGLSTPSLQATSPVVTVASAFNQITGTVFYPSRTVTSALSGFTGIYRSGIQAGRGAAGAATPASATLARSFGAGLGSAGVRAPVLASMGQAAPMGKLSVPQNWAASTPVASPANEPLWLSENDLGAVEAAPAAGMVGGAPTAGMGPMAGMLARPTVSSVLRVGPRRFTMPRPFAGG